MIEAAKYATATLKLDVINELFRPDLFAPSTFDFIIMDQVLEHVPNPLPMLRATFRLLKPHGILFLAVPPVDWSRVIVSASFLLPRSVVGAFDRSYFGRFTELGLKYDTFRFPEGHINYLSARAIAVLAANCEAKVLEPYHVQRWRMRWWTRLGLSTGSFFLRK